MSGGRPSRVEIGKKYGMLTVLSQADSVNGTRQFNVKCDCGGNTIVRGTYLIDGHTKSCGCLMPKGYKRHMDLKRSRR